MEFNPEDKDLRDILSRATDEELDPYFDCFLGKNRAGRFSSEIDPFYANDPDHPTRYWKMLGIELQTYGGNTVANMVRGHGVCYREILKDVAKRLKVSFKEGDSSKAIETFVLEKIITDIDERLTPAQREEILRDFQANGESKDLKGVLKSSAPGALIYLFRMGGFRSYQLLLVMANTLWKILFSRGFSLAGNVLLVRVASVFAGPIGWLLSVGWLAIDLMGPAYRVTVPAVLYTAMLRRIQEERLSANTK